MDNKDCRCYNCLYKKEIVPSSDPVCAVCGKDNTIHYIVDCCPAYKYKDTNNKD